jgi:sugar lactone lactonase YvrE
VSHVNWSLDATKIFYNRHSDVPVGIYSVPALGGEERLVLENANGGEPLPDGSLLVSRINGNRQVQIYRYWPGDGRLHPLPGVLRNSEAMPVRVVPGGSHAVFLGKSVDQPETDRATHLYLLDLATEKTRRVSTGFGEFANFAAFDSLAVMPDGQSALVVAANGDLTSVVSVDLNASRPGRTLIDLQASTGYIDVGPDGSLYIDQVQRPVEVARFSSTGTALERFTVFPNSKSEYGIATRVLYAPDGKTWIANAVGGRHRLFVAGASQATTPAIDTDEETDGPLAPLGDDRAVFVIGSADRRQIAIASLRDGRILRRLDSPSAATITALIASNDAKTLYYVDSGTVWSVPIDGGQPRKIHNGDGVVLTPDGQHLIVQLIETGGVRWLRVGLDGSGEETIPVKGDAHFTFVPIGPKAVGADGRIVLPIAVKDSWFWAPAIFDPKTGTVDRIPLPFQADPPSPAWTSDGKIVSVVYSLTSSLWRFRPSQSAPR